MCKPKRFSKIRLTVQGSLSWISPKWFKKEVFRLVKNLTPHITHERYIDLFDRVKSVLIKACNYIANQLCNYFSRFSGFNPHWGMEIPASVGAVLSPPESMKTRPNSAAQKDTHLGTETSRLLLQLIQHRELTNCLELLEEARYAEERALLMLTAIQLGGAA